MPMQESGENYLETILLLHDSTGFVRSIDIANALDYSKASISRAVSILKNDNYITVDTTGQILLTDKGRQRANEIFERHRYITKYLEMTLGIEHELADADACRIEHVISQKTFDRLKKYVNENEEE